jgi:acyl-CoA thioester hydrolase
VPQGWSSPVRFIECDQQGIAFKPAEIGRSSLAVRFVVRVGDRVCCEVRTTYVCTSDGRSTAWPEKIRQLVSAA